MGHRGDPNTDALVVADRYGYRVSGVHTFGDKACLKMLDAIEQADWENKKAIGKGVFRKASAPLFDIPGFPNKWQPIKVEIARFGNIGYAHLRFTS